MKRLFFNFFLLSTIAANAVSQGACIFTMFNPSATNNALGIVTGGANIWNQNPLDLWDNPAKLGYYKGLSLGNSYEQLYEGMFDDISISAAYITLGWRGIGIMLPTINAHGKFGTSMVYGNQQWYDADGNFVKTFESWESSSGFAFGVNVLEVLKSFNYQNPITRAQEYYDFSIGYNYNIIKNQLAPVGQTEVGQKGEGNSHADGLGMIFRFSPLNELNYTANSFIKTDFVASLYLRNISKTKIYYINEEQSDPVAYSTDTAFSFRVAVSADNYDDLSGFCTDVFSVYGCYGNSTFMDYEESSGGGIDLTFLDILSLRWGYIHDPEGGVEHRTLGIGLNFRYKDLVHLQCNYANYPRFDNEYEHMTDIMININLLEIIGKGNL